MMRSIANLLLAIGVALTHASGQSLPESPVASDSEIRKIIAERIDTERSSEGTVVGVSEPMGRRIISYGLLDKGDNRPLNGDTFFEIGSITKVFTSLLLADMVERGELMLDSTSSPERESSFAQRKTDHPARHFHARVGLRRMPSNFHPADDDNPFADYDTAKLYEFLSGYTLTRDIGQKYEYSNLAFGLLG